MDLMENVPENNKKVTKVKVWFIVVIVLIILLIIAAVAIWIYSQNLAKNRFKFYVDGKLQSEYEEDMFFVEGDKVYISIKRIASFLGYTAYNGGYEQYTEDRTKCNVTNSKEAVSFEANSNKIYKYNVLDANNSESQMFTIDEPIRASGSDLYISSEGLSRAFNIMISRDASNNTVTMFTLNYLADYYSKQVQNSAITSDTSSFSESVTFNNQKAVLYDMMIVKDATTNQYGVVSISDPTNQIIGARYSSIEFMEGSNDFIVKTRDSKVGIIGSDGVTKVKLEYDDIKEIDKNLGLYLVTSNNKQGVVNKNGKIIVYQEYDQIGLSNTIDDENVTNRYILYDNCIPVKRNNLWGLIDINGNLILPIEYDGLGCSADTSTDTRASDVLIIPEIDGIVVEKDEMNGNSRVRKYGIINSDGTLFINIVLDSIYSLTSQGNVTYYASVQNQIIDIVEFVYQQQAGIGDGTIQTGNEVNENTNTNTSGNVNSVTSNTESY